MRWAKSWHTPRALGEHLAQRRRDAGRLRVELEIGVDAAREVERRLRAASRPAAKLGAGVVRRARAKLRRAATRSRNCAGSSSAPPPRAQPVAQRFPGRAGARPARARATHLDARFGAHRERGVRRGEQRSASPGCRSSPRAASVSAGAGSTAMRCASQRLPRQRARREVQQLLRQHHRALVAVVRFVDDVVAHHVAASTSRTSAG